MTPLLEVLDPGFLTTVQDLGRPSLGHLGVPRSGAADAWSASVANLLLRNPIEAAVLECTIVGPSLRALQDTVVAVAGADLGAHALPGKRRLTAGASHVLAAGEVLSMPGPGAPGARAYLAVAGGIDVPVVLGSRSTCLAAGFGGLDGRALRAGDVVAAVGPGPGRPAPIGGLRWTRGPDDPVPGTTGVRVLPSPDAVPDALSILAGSAWTVSPTSDRRGLRLVGSPLNVGTDAGDRLTAGVVPGVVQLPPDGLPVVLLCDAPPTGGYPVVAVAIDADQPILGQLAPGSSIRFTVLDTANARAANIARRDALTAGRARLREAAAWDALSGSAGT